MFRKHSVPSDASNEQPTMVIAIHSLPVNVHGVKSAFPHSLLAAIQQSAPIETKPIATKIDVNNDIYLPPSVGLFHPCFIFKTNIEH